MRKHYSSLLFFLLIFLLLCDGNGESSNSSSIKSNKEFYASGSLQDNIDPFKPTSLLVTMLMYDFRNYEASIQLFHGYRDICEAGWRVKIVILTAATLSDDGLNLLNRTLWCYRINDAVPVEIRKYDKNLGMAIVEYSRQPSADYLDQFHLFMYIEDDMLFRYSTLIAWLAETKKLTTLIDNQVLHDNIHCSYKYPCKFNIGFLRVVTKKTTVPGDLFVDHHFLRGVHLEETPTLNIFCIKNESYISVMDHVHQAVWIETREDLKFLNETCNFLQVPPWKGPDGFVLEYFAGYSLFRNRKFVGRPLNCMVTKIIPSEKLEEFTIEHFRRSSKPPRAPNDEKSTLYFVDEMTRKGLNYNDPKSAAAIIPECWKN